MERSHARTRSLHTSVPFVMFGGAGWVCGGVWSGVHWCGDTVRERVRLVSSRGQSDGVRFVVSCDHESGLCMCLCLFF